MNREYERSLLSAGQYAVGIDEAGRGPLAGPVVAAAVILPEDLSQMPIALNDSKKLTAKERELLFDHILSTAVSYGIAARSREVIDEVNILMASMQAMTEAVEQCLRTVSNTDILLLVDGNYFRTPLRYPFRTIIEGDGKCPSIAAASILAKVTRDRMMLDIDERFPQYGFASHKGYATKQHINAIKTFGYCEEHRRSFRLRSIEQTELFTDT